MRQKKKINHSSAQIDLIMHEFRLLLFSHALRYHYVFGII